MLKYLIIFSLIYISGCTVKNNKNNKSDRVNFEELSKELFSSFGYTTKVIFHKEELDLINIYISKSKMTKNDFKKNIESVLLEKGWVEIPSDFDDQFIYCFDKKNALEVLYPTKEYYGDDNGNSIDVDKDSLDKWIVTFNYNMYGMTSCSNFKK